MTTTRAYQAGREWADAVGYRDAPLSGEWAGESIPELSDRFGVDLWDDDNATQFEEGFSSVMTEPDWPSHWPLP